MDRCFSAVYRWFTINGPPSNTEKSETIVVGTSARHRHEGEIGTVQLSNADICVFESVHGHIDSTMWLDQHVTFVHSAA